MSLIRSNKIVIGKEPIPAGKAISEHTEAVDMLRFRGVTYIVPIADASIKGAASVRVFTGDSPDFPEMEEIEGAKASVVCEKKDEYNNKLLIVEVQRPPGRYTQAVIESSGANVAFGTTLVILSGSRSLPVRRGSAIADRAFVAH